MNRIASDATETDMPKTRMGTLTDLLRGSAFVRNSAILFAGSMVANALNYFFHFVIGRMVSVSAYGEIESLASLLAIVSVPAAALSLIATKYGAAAKAGGDLDGGRAVFRYLNGKIFLYGAPLLVVLMLLTPMIRTSLKIESEFSLFYVWILMFLSFLGAVTGGLLGGWQRFGAVNAFSIGSNAVRLIAGAGLVAAGFGVDGAVGALLLAGVFGYMASLMFLKFLFREGVSLANHPPSRFHTDLRIDVGTIRHYAGPALLGTLAVTLLGNADMVAAKYQLDANGSGEYGALFIVSKTIFFVTGAITSVLFAMAAEESHKQRDSFPTFQLAAVLTGIVCAGSLLVFMLFPKMILGLLFGQKYLSVSSYLGWFALAASLYAFVNLLLQYLLSLHRTSASVWFCAVAALEMILLYFFGSSLYAIILLVVAVQILAIFVGIFFVLRSRRALYQPS